MYAHCSQINSKIVDLNLHNTIVYFLMETLIDLIFSADIISYAFFIIVFIVILQHVRIFLI